jgi:ribonuclease J
MAMKITLEQWRIFCVSFPRFPFTAPPSPWASWAPVCANILVDPKSLNSYEITPGQIVQIGPFEVEFIRVGHSIPDACGLAIKTELGTVVQSGDFKFDQTPIDGRRPQFDRFAHYGEEGVLALLSDTTNAGRAGMAGSELTVRPGLERIFADAPGRIFVTTFASNVHRVQQVMDIAHLYGRRVACTGRSMLTITKIATEWAISSRRSRFSILSKSTTTPTTNCVF